MRALAVMLAACTLGSSANAQTFKVIYTFPDTRGNYPQGTLLLHQGILYGTTLEGGRAGDGSVFELAINSEHSRALYSFESSPDGATPVSGLVRDSAGNLYGTTAAGGSSNVGTVFTLTAGGVETVLHNFVGIPDGYQPIGGLVRDASGNLYGTTQYGGVTCPNGGIGCGMVFKIDPSGNFTALHDFTGTDGFSPQGTLLLQGQNLYGTTAGGGLNGTGSVFAVNATTGTTKLIYSFPQPGGLTGSSGFSPVAGLISDGAGGNVYGTTTQGGAGPFGNYNGYGVVFSVRLLTGEETVLHTFNGNDGVQPYAALVRDKAGSLYGTTEFGGAAFVAGGNPGYGTIFKLDVAGNFTTLYSFAGKADGAQPYAGLTLDSMGNIYGAAQLGGLGGGTVFEITQ